MAGLLSPMGGGWRPADSECVKHVVEKGKPPKSSHLCPGAIKMMTKESLRGLSKLWRKHKPRRTCSSLKTLTWFQSTVHEPQQLRVRKPLLPSTCLPTLPHPCEVAEDSTNTDWPLTVRSRAGRRSSATWRCRETILPPFTVHLTPHEVLRFERITI